MIDQPAERRSSPSVSWPFTSASEPRALPFSSWTVDLPPCPPCTPQFARRIISHANLAKWLWSAALSVTLTEVRGNTSDGRVIIVRKEVVVFSFHAEHETNERLSIVGTTNTVPQYGQHHTVTIDLWHHSPPPVQLFPHLSTLSCSLTNGADQQGTLSTSLFPQPSL